MKHNSTTVSEKNKLTFLVAVDIGTNHDMKEKAPHGWCQLWVGSAEVYNTTVDVKLDMIAVSNRNSTFSYLISSVHTCDSEEHCRIMLVNADRTFQLRTAFPKKNNVCFTSHTPVALLMVTIFFLFFSVSTFITDEAYCRTLSPYTFPSIYCSIDNLLNILYQL